MLLWNDDGSVALAEGCTLRPHMSAKELRCVVARLADAPPWDESPDPVIPLPSVGWGNGRLAPVCCLHGDRLHAVVFTVVGVGARRGTADQQRAYLFACAHAQDPAPDTRRCVLLRCGFGTALISTDPRTGTAQLRLTYR